MDQQGQEKAAWIRRTIEHFLESPENTLGNSTNDKAYEKPIVGFARGDDPIFEQFKTDIGSFYLTPLESFEQVYPGSGAKAEELTVISWILPHTRQTKTSNRKEKAYPSERWARGKKFGELGSTPKDESNSIGHLAGPPVVDSLLQRGFVNRLQQFFFDCRTKMIIMFCPKAINKKTSQLPGHIDQSGNKVFPEIFS